MRLQALLNLLLWWLCAVALARDTSKLDVWPAVAHADDIEDVVPPGPAHLPPVLIGLTPQLGPDGKR